MIEKEFNDRIYTKSTAKREKNAKKYSQLWKKCTNAIFGYLNMQSIARHWEQH